MTGATSEHALPLGILRLPGGFFVPHSAIRAARQRNVDSIEGGGGGRPSKTRRMEGDEQDLRMEEEKDGQGDRNAAARGRALKQDQMQNQVPMQMHVVQVQQHGPESAKGQPQQHAAKRGSKKVRKACEFCTLKKIKCSGGLPCDQCAKRGSICEYAERKQTRAFVTVRDGMMRDGVID